MEANSTVALCNNLSHLIYKLHNSLDYKQKFILFTHIFSVQEEHYASEEMSRRLIMSLDPEFVYILLRSSSIFVLISLELTNKLICNKDAAKHMSNIVPYIANILSRIVPKADFILDESTKIISDKLMYQKDFVWIKLVYESLLCLQKILSYLGKNKLLNCVTLDEMRQPLEYLLNDMFDISIENISFDGSRESGIIFNHNNDHVHTCNLCDLISKNEFKDEALCIQNLFSDLDALAREHLIDLDKDKLDDYASDDEIDLFSLIKDVGNTIITDIGVTEGNKLDKQTVGIYLSTLKIVLEITKRDELAEFVLSCIESKNFDILQLLIELSIKGSNDLGNLTISKMLTNHSIKLLDKNTERHNVLCLLGYIQKSLERHGLYLFNDNCCVDEILKIIKRAEIELHLSLDEFFRIDNTEYDYPCTFRVLETIFVLICDLDQSVGNSVNSIFTIIHRVIQTTFDFFNQIDISNRERASDYISCCTRIIGCWMTLEPVHLQSAYLRALSNMLDLISEMDFAWLLPTFDYIEVCDLSNVNNLMTSMFRIINRATGKNGNVYVSALDNFGDETLTMACRHLERFFMDVIVDFERLLQSLEPFDINHTTLPVDKEDVIETLITSANFTPSYPVELFSPIVVEVDVGSKLEGKYLFTLSVLEKLFLSILERYHHVKFVNHMLKVINNNEEPSLEYFFQSLAKKSSSYDILLCNISVATAAACLCRITETSAKRLINSKFLLLIMECLVYSFFYSVPVRMNDYLRTDDERINLWYRTSHLSMLLMQHYPALVGLFNMSIIKMGLKLPQPSKIDMETLFNEEYITRQEIVVADFFSAFVLNIIN
ncbi:conserved hypothetical protein [Theileria equi strain WA]|uniref:Uncharacterized protein n=1 Tax=Theileria equi strain WA TaxID=1537102 RepID=L1LF22_THEEQ|nr:conserved hypothetical protein [Theileria equi strain WA]EKX74042.1 conserved hypothetical protein [Theileria equi strain WA]|eukprot:XP_004833494.1 conserved hypothetical protein [Theileria equi strain WA]